MGADMVTMTLPLSLQRQPDWRSAARAIRDVRLQVLWGTGELYDWETWLHDTDNLPGAVPAFMALRAAQRDLHRYACLLRGAIEHGWPDELIELVTPTHRIWVTGVPSWGEDPGDLVGPAIYLAEAGVTDAAGFEGYTHYEETPIGSRSFGFSAEALRATRFGVAAAHAAEQAAAMKHPGAAAPAQTWFSTWLLEIETGADDPGRRLLRFAARGLALSAWLKDPGAPLEHERLDDRGLELTRIADEGGLSDRPCRRSPDAALRELRALVGELRERFEQFDDPAAHDDEDVRSYIWNAGGTFGDALEVEVAAHPLFAAVTALADLYGDDIAALIDAPAAPIEAEPPPGSRTRFAPLVQYLSLIVVGEVDWDAAEGAVQALDPEVREERSKDLDELRRLIAADEYRRFATSGQPVGDHRIYVAAPHGEPSRPDIAPGVGRLGRDGVLDAAGVVRWSAPDPTFSGPVESYVPGYGPKRR
ncbi:MAG: hypothetical protein M3P34_09305 [Actinomycetota bacterium]|nr:hypothetical protein [Actinomycetota bacterium]